MTPVLASRIYMRVLYVRMYVRTRPERCFPETAPAATDLIHQTSPRGAAGGLMTPV